ncbi:MAG: hypothetical protein WCX31_00920 [Salinivirgaceae bacterium]
MKRFILLFLLIFYFTFQSSSKISPINDIVQKDSLYPNKTELGLSYSLMVEYQYGICLSNFTPKISNFPIMTTIKANYQTDFQESWRTDLEIGRYFGNKYKLFRFGFAFAYRNINYYNAQSSSSKFLFTDYTLYGTCYFYNTLLQIGSAKYTSSYQHTYEGFSLAVKTSSKLPWEDILLNAGFTTESIFNDYSVGISKSIPKANINLDLEYSFFHGIDEFKLSVLYVFD